jgi:subtilisin family serine protease
VAASLAASVARDQSLPRDFSSWQSKIDLRLSAAPPGEEQDLLVVLRDQADLSGARDLPTRAEKAQYVFEKLKETADSSQRSLRAELDASGTEHQDFWITNMIRVRGTAEEIEALARRPDVSRVEANLARFQDLPQPHAPTGLDITSALAGGPEPNLVTIEAPLVWAAGVTGQGIVIGGGDTGYDWTHPALKGKYRGWNGATADHNYNWHDAIHNAGAGNVCGSNSPVPCDDDSHGTHTMGTAVGDDGNGNQIGVAPGAKWIGCRNMDRGVGTPARYTECFQWFLAPTNSAGANPDPSKSPDVITNSWDCPVSEGCTNPDTLKSIVQNVRAAGIAVIVSAGNGGAAGCNGVGVPQLYEDAIAVGATDTSDVVASFSSRGPGENGSIKPQVVAPGTNIRSSVPGGGYAVMGGTSMAAPHAAGLAALLLSASPSLSGNVSGLEALMEQSAVPKTTTQTCGGITAGAVPNNTAGWGRIDALAAYTRALAPNTPPSVVLTSPTNGAVFTAPATISLVASVSDDGSVVRADFFSGSTRLATDRSAPFAFDWSGVPAGTYTLSAVATDDHGATTTSATVSVTVQNPPDSLPSPWSQQDVGSVGLPGSATESGGTFTVLGSGADVWGYSDQFHFVSQTLSGDGEIRARVASVTNTSPYAKAGVMIRQDVSNNSPYAMMELLPNRSAAFQWRLTKAAVTQSVGSPSAPAPYWVRLVRSGNTITAYRSSNGTAWTTVGSQTVTLPQNVLVGLAVTAHNNATKCTAVFDNLSVASGANTPPNAAITNPANGAVFQDPPSISIEAQASDPDPGGSVTQVAFFDGANLLGARTSTPYTFVWNSPSAGAHSLTVRATDNAGAVTTSAAVGITVNLTPPALPPPWVEQDVGAVALAGSASEAGGAFTVLGSGTDIWGFSDQFHFVYQSLSGDGEITARVASVQNTNPYAKSGVMIRQDLSADSPYAFTEILPRGSSGFQWRPTKGAATQGVSSAGAAPYWVRLVRSGNTFTAYRSSNGTTWTTVGSQNLNLSQDLLVGLAVTAHNNAAKCTAVFDNVTVVP